MRLERLEAGKLRNYVALQNYTESRTGSGFAQRTWSTYASVWAGVRTLSGGERLSSQQVGGTLTHEFSIRWRSGVHVDHRILWDGRYFDIKDVRNVDEANIEIRMLCSEVMAAGPSASSSPSASASASPSSSASA